MPRPPLPLVLPLLALLAGCEFFVTPPPDPALDGALSCGEAQPLDGMTGADDLPIDADGPIGLTIATDFDDPDVAGVLEVRRDDGAVNLAEFRDPTTGGTALTTSLAAGDTARVELFVPGGGAIAGTLRLECPAAEVCWDLADNNGDGRTDCADPLCAREPDCAVDQRLLATASIDCGGFVPIEAPVLRPIDAQRTLYTTFPLGQSLPFESFWGGAEIALTGSPAGSTVTVRATNGGMVCPGTESSATVLCEGALSLSPGAEISVPGGGTLFLEPLGLAWEGLEVRVDCPEDRR